MVGTSRQSKHRLNKAYLLSLAAAGGGGATVRGGVSAVMRDDGTHWGREGHLHDARRQDCDCVA